MDILSNIIDLFIYADKISLAVNILLILVVRVLLCIAVYSNAEQKRLSEIKNYAELVVAFGIVGYAVFMLLTRKITSSEKKGREVVLALVSVVLLCANISLFSYTDESAELNYKTQYYGFDFSVGIFEAENGDKIRYNNLGQGFSLKNMDAFFYQTKDGERYQYDTIKEMTKDDFSTEYCFKSNGEFCVFELNNSYKRVFINEDLRVGIDSNGELYYDYKDCYFDKEGNFIFYDDALYDVTYDSALACSKNSNNNP